ncbi:uncharacterized protein LOC117175146 [Belonocnema kinseyi]|uniref:uncharacterized protein LOC117175146 n=1 Tax=Belonocnema kinseyi TaxID=2817044 RepID=UPI00143D1405|nr:uncharacterized protein LOC117175146 [Belonocnema kinseyi]
MKISDLTLFFMFLMFHDSVQSSSSSPASSDPSSSRSRNPSASGSSSSNPSPSGESDLETALSNLSISEETREELIGSTPTLEKLFPGYNGILPLVKFLYMDIQRHPNFLHCDGRLNLFHHDQVFLVRDHYIFGSRWDDSIRQPCNVQDRSNVYAVFCIKSDQWIRLSPAVFRKLGANRRFSIVTALDQIAVDNIQGLEKQSKKYKHKMACLCALAAAYDIEKNAAPRLETGETTIPQVIHEIGDIYNSVYRRVYNRITRQNWISRRRRGNQGWTMTLGQQGN